MPFPRTGQREKLPTCTSSTHLLWLLVKSLDPFHQCRLLLFRALESAWVVGYVWGPTSSDDIGERKSIERCGSIGHGCAVSGFFRRCAFPGSPGHKGAKNRSETFETLSAKLRFRLAKRGRVYSMRVAKGASAEGRRYIRILQLRWLWRDAARSVRALWTGGTGLGAAAEFRNDVNEARKV